METNYYVVLFHRRDGDLVGSPPTKVPDYLAAVGEAQFQAQEAAGAIAFALTGEGSEDAEFEFIFKTGDAPDAVPGIWEPATAS
jgi:hypothetical protein